jgi:hypothetical protein
MFWISRKNPDFTGKIRISKTTDSKISIQLKALATRKQYFGHLHTFQMPTIQNLDRKQLIIEEMNIRGCGGHERS